MCFLFGHMVEVILSNLFFPSFFSFSKNKLWLSNHLPPIYSCVTLRPWSVRSVHICAHHRRMWQIQHNIWLELCIWYSWEMEEASPFPSYQTPPWAICTPHLQRFQGFALPWIMFSSNWSFSATDCRCLSRDFFKTHFSCWVFLANERA